MKQKYTKTQLREKVNEYEEKVIELIHNDRPLTEILDVVSELNCLLESYIVAFGND